MNMFYYAHVPYHRRKPDLSAHFWLLESVFNEYIKKREDEKARLPIASILHRYVVAMSCGKMDVRLNSHISRRYIASLKNIDLDKIPLPSHMREGLKSTQDNDKDEKEGLNDYWLQNVLLQLSKKEGVSHFTPSVSNLANMKIPEPSSSSGYKRIMIYNDSTYKEFHQFYLDLLYRFRKAIHNLCVQQQKKGRINEQRFGLMAKHIFDAQFYGYALLKLARGRAFRLHITNISNMLEPDLDSLAASDPASDPNQQEDEKNAEDYNDNGDNDNKEGDDGKAEGDDGQAEGDDGKGDEDECDYDMEAVAAVNHPNCILWTRLTAAHIDAIDIILTFFLSSKFRYGSINMKLLRAPLATTKLLPWRDLLRSTVYCPDPTCGSDPTQNNANIVEFLDKNMHAALATKEIATSAESVNREWSASRRLPTGNNSTAIKTALEDLYGKVVDEGLKKQIRTIIKKLKQRPNATNNSFSKELVDSIENVIARTTHVPQGNEFFCVLNDLQFKGAIHCEATLASLINNNATKQDHRTRYALYKIDQKLLQETQVSILILYHLLSHSQCYLLRK